MGGVIRSGIGDIFLAWSEHGCSKGEKKDTMMEVGEENIIRQSTCLLYTSDAADE